MNTLDIFTPFVRVRSAPLKDFHRYTIKSQVDTMIPLRMDEEEDWDEEEGDEEDDDWLDEEDEF